MNQKTGIVIGIVVVLLLALGGGVYLMMKSKAQSPSGAALQPVMEKTAAPETLQGTLKNLLTSGKSIKCSFDDKATDSAKVSGTVYITGGKMRGDFSATAKDMAINSHMIADGQNSYVWTEGAKQGYKFSMADQKTVGTSVAGKTQGPDLNQAVNYSCQDWNGDKSMLTMPTDITFSTLEAPTVPTTPGTTGTGFSCAACDSIPAGSNRDMCKAQLHCP